MTYNKASIYSKFIYINYEAKYALMEYNYISKAFVQIDMLIVSGECSHCALVGTERDYMTNYQRMIHRSPEVFLFKVDTFRYQKHNQIAYACALLSSNLLICRLNLHGVIRAIGSIHCLCTSSAGGAHLQTLSLTAVGLSMCYLDIWRDIPLTYVIHSRRDQQIV